jgi:hypothetical protein
MPNAEDANYSATFSTANNLETLFTSVAESYNSDFETWRTSLGVTYSGFYPVLDFGASLGKVGDTFGVPTFFGKVVPYTFTWKENIYSASVSLPLNLSRLYYTQKVNVGVGLSWYDVSDKPIATYEEIPNDGFGIMYSTASYSWSRHSAYRDFKSPLSFAVGAAVYKSLTNTDVEASMVSVAASATVPGFFRQNYFTLSGNVIRQNQKLSTTTLYLLDHSAFDLRGYSSMRMQGINRLSAEYSFPLGYPDFGIPCVIWIKRFRGSIIGDVAQGELFRKKYDFTSAGFKLLADFCVLRLNYNISVGVTVAKGLTSNGLERTESSLVLSLPF